MKLRESLRTIATTLRQHLAFYRALYHDPRTPRLARILLWAALAYVAMPFDLIPDFLHRNIVGGCVLFLFSAAP